MSLIVFDVLFSVIFTRFLSFALKISVQKRYAHIKEGWRPDVTSSLRRDSRPFEHYVGPHPLEPATAAVAQWYSPPAQARKQTAEVARGFESTRGAFSEMMKNRRQIIRFYRKIMKNH